ncbi:transcriptional regulator NrdR [Meiothermus ruber]|jgi:transcriptional repressor NrdR|uniref:Transcriptional repressor NrdR n=1 Tax=Meiothermus ruber (strain ATCC 35948 / DSM 1279 / VKM B-1258 / 21) TaxID=504728 RepID=A0A806DFW5_MEIRD|nr:transcriptional regulator NrdR [Meiothermus ruber]ADD26844.1 ATP-cone domain protein [Meiothermus ruber DSM 1279]MCL6529779.1 transcriptional regulator NrdR [Meiothermus ruber]
MNCPFCGNPDSRVLDSRPSDEGSVIRRRRECPVCKRRFTTYERAQVEPLLVIKRSGRKETFDPNKLLRGLSLAARKRPIDPEVLQEFAFGFEDTVKEMEITSEEIGLRSLAFLKELDPVAYIRFASVYREFDSLENFIEEVRKLDRKPGKGKKAQKAEEETPDLADEAKLGTV